MLDRYGADMAQQRAIEASASLQDDKQLPARRPISIQPGAQPSVSQLPTPGRHRRPVMPLLRIRSLRSALNCSPSQVISPGWARVTRHSL